MDKRTIGAAYEQKAVLFLQNKGYEILEQNFYCRQGEIDIIAKQGEYLVFVEVKYRKSSELGGPEEAVNYMKQRRIIYAAKYYLYSHFYREETPCRFDVVTFCGEDITLLENAFET